MALPAASASPPKALLKFYAISAAIVLTIAVVVAGYANRDRIRLKIASVHASVPPKPSQAVLEARRRERAFGLAAPWVLSALPECLRQTFEAAGEPSYVAAKMPTGYERVVSGAQLRYADCTLTVQDDMVLIHRGDDKFFVPSPSQLYRKGANVALVYETGARALLRVYEPAAAQP